MDYRHQNMIELDTLHIVQFSGASWIMNNKLLSSQTDASLRNQLYVACPKIW